MYRNGTSRLRAGHHPLDGEMEREPSMALHNDGWRWSLEESKMYCALGTGMTLNDFIVLE